MGPDGSGKTFFINYLIKKLKIKNIIIKRIHLKPALINSNIKNVSNPHSKKPRNVLFSILKLLYWLLTYYLFGLLKYFPNKKKIYIFDRYVHDVLVDPLRYRVKLNFIIKFIINFFPKPEIKYDTLSKQLISYKKLKKKLSNSFFISNKFDFIEILNVIKKKIKL
jgi:hypothetical protein